MTKYDLMYKNFKPEVVTAVRLAVKSGLFKKENSIEFKMNILQELHVKLCNVYNLNVIPLMLDKNVGATCGKYVWDTAILINKPSLVTYLHEFYHFKAHKLNGINDEIHARGWSLSLYHTACPKLFAQAVKNKLILFSEGLIEEEK